MFFEFSSLLTNNQLFHFFPLNIISCFVSDSNCDPPLNTLWSRRKWKANQFITGVPDVKKTFILSQDKRAECRSCSDGNMVKQGQT